MGISTMRALALFVMGLVLSATPALAITPAEITASSERLGPDLIAFRRDLHMHPELSGNERRTSKRVADRLSELGLEVHTGIGGYGVVGILRGGLPGPVVAYRADMDAIPIEQVGEQSWRSQVPGVSHACGHDVHTSIAIGIASVLAPMASEIKGSVVFIFQPAEETVQGARLMLSDGVLDFLRPDAIFAVHTSAFPVGLIGIGPDVGLSGSSRFALNLSGGTEGKRTELADALLEQVMALGTIPGPQDPRSWPLMSSITEPDSPLKDFVYMVARVDDDAELGTTAVKGRFRFPNEAVRGRTAKALEKLAKESEKGGVSAVLELPSTYLLPTQADPVLAENAFAPVTVVLSTPGPIRLYASVPYFGEDFSFFQAEIPGALFLLGTSNSQEGIHARNHSPDYDVDESSIVIGTKAMTSVLLNYLGH